MGGKSTVIPPKGIPSHYVQDAQGNWSHPSRVVGALLPAKSQSNPLPALDQKPKACRNGKRRVVVRVTLIRCSSNSLDDDNLASAFKGTRDAIARSLAIDDADYRIKWECGQVETKASSGTLVKIECL